MLANKKYTLIKDDFIKLSNGVKLYRITALRDILTDRIIVLTGQKGGYIENERNLSHNGDAWVCEGSIVRENAFVCRDAIIKGKSELWGEAYVSGSVTVNNCFVCDNTVVTDKCDLNNCVLSGERNISGTCYYDGVKIGEFANVDAISQSESVSMDFDVMQK